MDTIIPLVDQIVASKDSRTGPCTHRLAVSTVKLHPCNMTKLDVHSRLIQHHKQNTSILVYTCFIDAILHVPNFIQLHGRIIDCNLAVKAALVSSSTHLMSKVKCTRFLPVAIFEQKKHECTVYVKSDVYVHNGLILWACATQVQTKAGKQDRSTASFTI